MSKGTGPLSNLYNAVVGTVGKVVPKSLEPLWESPAGPQTIFFWAPLFKWGLVIAGLGDVINRPAHAISLTQSIVIAATGLIWTRWSMVIVPVNYSLAAVNGFVFLTQSLLFYRGVMYQRQQGTQAQYASEEDDYHRNINLPWIIYFS